jgi:hypothetical protein
MTFKDQKYLWLIDISIYGHILRNCTRLLDFEKSKEILGSVEWILLVDGQIFGTIALLLLVTLGQRLDAKHLLINIMLYLYLFVCNYVAMSDEIHNANTAYIIMINLVALYTTFIFSRINREFMDSQNERKITAKWLSQILQSLQE